MSRRRVGLGAAAVLLAMAASGCGGRPASPEEATLLRAIAHDISDLRGRYEQLRDYDPETAFRHQNSVSYLYEPHPGTLVLMNSGNYWFKVSTSKDPVQAFDNPGPVLNIELPRFGRWLKLRVRGSDQELTEELARIVGGHAKEAGGTRALYRPENAIEQAPARGSRRMRTV
ncbi:MAG: hypothetical protein MOGMAGMI_01579 [Candidatus Omnitrophica bacterium]|nr:hypothetical protein [Candidatus Omnitrophota bacterium]